MLSIRMQRTGRKGHAMFRVVVQESRLTPSSGKVVAMLGSYDPHTKAVVLQKEKASFYLEHGAQPSGRAAVLLQKEGIKMPKWVKLSDAKTGTIRHSDKLRRNQPKTEAAPAEKPAEPEEPAETEAAAEPATEAPAAEAAAADAPEAEANTEA